MPRFAYDISTDKCVPFNYGGCAGNDNKFATIKECQDTCVRAVSLKLIFEANINLPFTFSPNGKKFGLT